MKIIDVALLPNVVNHQLVTGSVAIIIDVLRASSSILTALSNGAKQVIPVNEPEEAKELAKRFPAGEVLLCGERDGNKISGFDLGNSPLEFGKEIVAGKTLIMSTTNGTKACHSAQNASSAVIGCFLNLTAISDTVKQTNENILLITSGKEGKFSLEDTVCAGALVDKLNAENEFALTDAARVAQILYTIYKFNLRQMFATCEHGLYLASLGYEPDLDYCAQVDTISLVPKFTSGIITI
jgi:2-phosphosulfolactate phosphatase